MAYSDDELLRLVGEERKRSLGFGEGDSGELTARRQTGIAYARGDMVNVSPEHKVPAPEGRSGVTDSTVADAIETLLPDIMEVFVGGDDIATFIPQGEQDEQAAQDETDYVTHVIFVENEGYLTLYTAIKDALQAITGVIHWWTEEDEVEEPIGQPMAPEMAQMAQAVAASQQMEVESEPQEDGTVQLVRASKTVKVCIKAVPCEDFTVAANTVSLRDTPYCAMRSRMQVQELIALGVDAEKARELPAYTIRNDTIPQARDEAGEHNLPQTGGGDDLRLVEVRAHYIRLLDDDNQLCLYRVLTDSEERVMLETDEVDHIPFAGGSPYIVPHRFYGEGVPDKAIEIQKIKTVLLRSHLDSIYFALNQRLEVSEADATTDTIADLLRNQPGVPIRSKTGNALKAIEAAPLNVDMLASLEYAATMAEGRTGIVRNAQGLNPDTLHDTAQGAMAMIGAAQKRVRMIARNFAETMIKDLFLGVHKMLRSAYTSDHKPASAKLRNKWQTVQPHTWPERNAMNIHVGVGSAGKEHDLAIAGKRLELGGQVAEQGGLGLVLDPKNIYNALLAFERAAGTRGPERYWTDPTAPPDPNNPPPQPPPNPEMVKVQGQQQLEQAKAQSQASLAQSQAQAAAQLELQKAQIKGDADEKAAQRDFALQQQRITAEMDLKREDAAQKMQLERWKAEQTLQLQREEAAATVQLKREEIRMKASTSTDVDEAVEGLPG